MWQPGRSGTNTEKWEGQDRGAARNNDTDAKEEGSWAAREAEQGERQARGVERGPERRWKRTPATDRACGLLTNVTALFCPSVFPFSAASITASCAFARACSRTFNRLADAKPLNFEHAFMTLKDLTNFFGPGQNDAQ